MNVVITARHFDPPDGVRDYALEKIDKVHKYYEKPIGCHIILSQENNERVAEISLSIAGKTIFVRETSDDLLRSIDGAVDKLIGRLIKFKTTRYAHK